ncbi:MAG: hypothetical protein H5T49_04160 [Hadesarchaea archaeon]|nr:hypothetical protein [Hadesarchaea archaeon]
MVPAKSLKELTETLQRFGAEYEKLDVGCPEYRREKVKDNPLYAAQVATRRVYPYIS